MKSQTLAVIPARAGSVGVKNKNLRILGDKPLICHTIDFAIKNKLNFLISTEDEAIAGTIKNYYKWTFDWNKLNENEVIFLNDNGLLHKRPVADAQNNSLISKVLFGLSHQKILQKYEYFMLLQATSPFREKQDLEQIFKFAENLGWSCIFSVKNVDGFHPNRMYEIQNNGRAHQLKGFDSEDNLPRQDLKQIFIKDGAYYLFMKKNLLKNIFIGKNPYVIVRESKMSVNIDSEIDLLLANLVWKVRHETNS